MDNCIKLPLLLVFLTRHSPLPVACILLQPGISSYFILSQPGRLVKHAAPYIHILLKTNCQVLFWAGLIPMDLTSFWKMNFWKKTSLLSNESFQYFAKVHPSIRRPIPFTTYNIISGKKKRKLKWNTSWFP